MKMNQLLVAGAMAVALCLSATQLLAQDQGGRKGGPGGGPGGPGGRGGFDPAQFEQRMMDQMRQALEVTSDDEWNVLQPRIKKVNDLRMNSFRGSMGSLFRGPGDSGKSRGGSSTRDRGAMPEAEALQRALDAKAPNAELKQALDRYVAAKKAKQAELEAAQAELRKIITVRQESLLSMWGIL